MPVVFETNKENKSFLSVWKIKETEKQLAELLSFTELMRNQLKLISNSEKRLEWLASRLLIQRLSGLPPCVSHTSSGKPNLNKSDLNVTISHTKGFAAVLISSQACGVDMEYPSSRISKLSERFVNPTEEKYISGRDEPTYHAVIWCAKETLYKTAGIQGIIFKDQMVIDPFLPEKSGTLSGRILFEDSPVQEYDLSYKITDEYYLVWHW
ncbi:4'-phosphopantetheinyl transferase family protein [Natronoflexus pectinivorans]|uniref:4'-phosphopantetheinyl transferase superfamily protein n=1 Tax=Natronoflexus pectinivorans TaxID=682526 RepID=A0A4R2GMM3_9BACT|nr:4'-phosphopantetheinyl transferase superfamily protein [Natronoflexus pectinivorans]TCO10473.1 4'-phosphopantetheinyl transferase superfamily protein [Natronoflexus pectinivorans]